jgi:CRISPR-associated endonuclease/helicase Cas3
MLAKQLNRVQIHWPISDQPTPYTDLAAQLQNHSQVLSIVHLRRDARILAEMLPDDHLHHLSTLMCAAHRRDVIKQIRTALQSHQPCRVVTTQLIEAGVDIDFPVVYRALAGLDSLAQAAGRCNREGKLPAGQFHIFLAETNPPPGLLRMGLETTRSMLKKHAPTLSFNNPDLFHQYFRMLYSKAVLDKHGIQVERENFNFDTVAAKFELIDGAGRTSLLVPYTPESKSRLANYRQNPNRQTLRALQPYTVQLFPYEKSALPADALEPINDNLDTLTIPYEDLYNPKFGLLINPNALPNPASLLI